LGYKKRIYERSIVLPTKNAETYEVLSIFFKLLLFMGQDCLLMHKRIKF